MPDSAAVAGQLRGIAFVLRPRAVSNMLSFCLAAKACCGTIQIKEHFLALSSWLAVCPRHAFCWGSLASRLPYMPGDSSRSSSPGQDTIPGPEQPTVQDGSDPSDASRQVPKPRPSQLLSLPSRAGRTSRTRGRLSVMQADALKSSKAALEQRHLHSNVSSANSEDTLGRSLPVSSDLACPAVRLEDVPGLLAELTLAREALQSARQEADVLAAFNEDASTSRFEELKAAALAWREEAKRHKDSLTEAANEAQRWNSEIDEQKHEFTGHMEAQRREKLEMESQVERLKGECDQLRLSEKILLDLKVEVAEKSEEIASLEKQQLQEAHTKDEQRTSELNHLQSTVVEVQTQRQELQKELEEAHADQRRQQEEVSGMKAEALELVKNKSSREAVLTEETLSSAWLAKALSEEHARDRSELESRHEILSKELEELSEEYQRSMSQGRSRLSEIVVLQAEAAQQSQERGDLQTRLDLEQHKSARLAEAEHQLSAALEGRVDRTGTAMASHDRKLGPDQNQELSEQMEYLRQQELDLRRAIAAHRYVVRNSTTVPPPAPVQQLAHECDDPSADEALDDEIGTTVKMPNRPSTSECQDFLFGLRRSGMPNATLAWLRGAT